MARLGRRKQPQSGAAAINPGLCNYVLFMKKIINRLIPRNVLFGNPDKASPKLSPDGSQLSYIAPVEGVLNVLVGAPDGSDMKAVTSDTDRGVRSYFWGQDSESILYVQDKGGDENWRLYRVRLDSQEIQELTPYDNVQVQIIEYTKDHPDKMVIGLNKDDERLHDAYLLHLESGKLELLEKNPGTVLGWMCDADLNLLGAMANRPDGSFDFKVRNSPSDEWRTLVTWDADNNLTSGPMVFTRDGCVLMRDSRDVNASRLVKYDLATNESEVLSSDPEYDVSNVMIHPDTLEVEMVGYERARLEWEVVDEEVGADISRVAKLNSGDFVVYDRTDDDRTWLAGFTEDTGPAAYYRYDRDKQEGELLFHNRDDLKDYDLCEMAAISFETRDGLTVHGYLTTPHGKSGEKKPLILNVHGGPWARDSWGYDPEAQWLANRGYACLQVNYRGSTGYGKDFLNAADREWGGKMHDDLVDAVEWAVKTKIADPERLAIYGGSYGGYAALAGATFTPDLFCCAVDIVGPSNLISFIETIPAYWSNYLEVLHKRVGNPEVDEEFLKSRSPLFHVDNIKIPMLIAQGANDPRVKQAESEQIVAAMSKNGIEHQYMLFPDEGHGFAKPENRLKFYAAAERFLAQHLGGRVE
jgi:dipeptidyl aminopeptidase/acylaminoacyl peptidase